MATLQFKKEDFKVAKSLHCCPLTRAVSVCQLLFLLHIADWLLPRNRAGNFDVTLPNPNA